MFERHSCDYEGYIKYQRETQSKRAVYTRDRTNRSEYVAAMKAAFPGAKSVLCVGARHPSEVEDVQKAGFDSVGIDLFSDSGRIIVLDMHKMGERFGEGEFDVALFSHSLEHSYDPGVVLLAARKVCGMGAFVVLPMLAKPNKREMVAFRFMRRAEPTSGQVSADLEPLAGPVEVPWVKSDSGRREISFPLVWKG